MNSVAMSFEKPVEELEEKLEELRRFSETQGIDMATEIQRLEQSIDERRGDIFRSLTPWQKVQVARHPNRPFPMDYVQALTTDYQELHGDRLYADDRAIVGGFARLDGRRVMVLCTRKGRDTKSNLECNFGCAYPEGYRKALRLMRLAAKFHVPIITLIDTPGAFPGVESEERHIAEAIAVNLREMFTIETPIVAVVTGEGGSGGALGIGVADRVLVLEHAYYSVISPEGCAAILWKDRAFADRAAEALKLTAQDLKQMGLADEIVTEPLGGAHADWQAVAANLKAALLRNLDHLATLDKPSLLQQRYDKFRSMGVYEEIAPPAEPTLPS